MILKKNEMKKFQGIIFIVAVISTISCNRQEKSIETGAAPLTSNCCLQDTVIRHIHSPVSVPDSGLAELKDGNRRYTEDKMTACNRYEITRKKSAGKQTPFAIIVSCSDSRVPPEIVFDQAIGDLFVIRVAGQALDVNELGTIEYAVEHLGVKLIVVLGHERCGAVTAAVEEGKVPGHIGNIVNCIKPAADKAKKMPGDPVQNAVIENVKMIVQKLTACEPILKEAVHKHELKIVGACYDLDDGCVTFL